MTGSGIGRAIRPLVLVMTGLALTAAFLAVGGGPLTAPIPWSTALASPARAEPATGPTPDGPALNLAVAVDDGRADAREGDEITYTARVRNAGGTDARDLVVTQTLPAVARVTGADRDGTIKGGTGDGGPGAEEGAGGGVVEWPVELAPGQEETFTVRARVGRVPPGLLRLATVVCVTTASDRRPVVCATDSDALPAAAADARTPGSTEGAGGVPGWLVPLIAAAAILPLGAGGLVLYLRMARRRARLAHRQARAATSRVPISETAPVEPPSATPSTTAGPRSAPRSAPLTGPEARPRAEPDAEADPEAEPRAVVTYPDRG
ncbi:DUF11 domain-containing protein [Frankia sp. CNm7]|uniref:DUF11 domain-containing protein n=1 Tax=Frankia nepalensis TaxID=1836974 RepID=A0A937RC63_9ACTN|nr:DUF11 domain-containing protein [Frankia nepalensis]MBL7497383.1 DUF11 domain-containing protein [Frankia nepalensis]MBL7512773.1 DUF11 domain-containing protein [Frankia nepalensis]MBL7522509.1 DUF11 domain-containing protein [Frankia nepalensis]MBL7629421.1 DUF11 domain-containing protein [Frankia nepalensis]